MSRSQLWTEENILIRNNIVCKSDTETCQRVLIFLGLGITCFIIGWFNFLIINSQQIKSLSHVFGRVTFISIIRSTFSPATTIIWFIFKKVSSWSWMFCFAMFVKNLCKNSIPQQDLPQWVIGWEHWWTEIQILKNSNLWTKSKTLHLRVSFIFVLLH